MDIVIIIKYRMLAHARRKFDKALKALSDIKEVEKQNL